MAQYGGYNQGGYGQTGGYNQQAGNPYAQGGNPYAQQQSNPYAQQQQQPQNPYAQQQSSRYGQQNPYAQQSTNPYAQQGTQNGGYGGDFEMGQVNGGGRGDLSILNELEDLRRAIDTTTADMSRIQQLHRQVLADTSQDEDSPLRRQRDQLTAQIDAALKNYTNRLTKIKGKPGAGNDQNSGQVSVTQRQLDGVLRQNMKAKQKMKEECEAQIRRRVDYANPNATEEDYQIAYQRPDQVFADATLSANRRGEAAQALNEVQQRSNELRRIEKEMIELAELIQQLNAVVQQQGEQAQEIEKKTKQVEEDNTAANGQLTVAVDKARAARNKKFICLGIVVLIILIVIGIAAGYLCSQPGKCGHA